MKRLFLLLLLILVVLTNDVWSQRRRMQDMPGKSGLERVEKFKKMRLIEVLNLSEEESIRFFAKQNQHEDKMRELMDVRKKELDSIEIMVKEKTDSKEIQKLINRVLDIDNQIYNERKRYQEELRTFLSTERFAKYLIFERDFDRKLRDAMMEMHRGKGQPPE